MLASRRENSTVKYSTVQYNTVQYSMIQYRTVRNASDWGRLLAVSEVWQCRPGGVSGVQAAGTPGQYFAVLNYLHFSGYFKAYSDVGRGVAAKVVYLPHL